MTKKKSAKKRSKSTRPLSICVVVKKQDPAVDPVVVSFPSGVPRSLTDSNICGDEPPKFAWRELENRKHGRLVVGSDETCVYQATCDGRGHDGRRTKLCVGILDKKTGKLEIRQAAQRGTVFALSQSVPSYKPQQDVRVNESNMSALERRRVLFESFGSAKKQKVLKSQHANVVNVDSVVGAGAVMMDAIQSQSMSASNRKAMEESKSGNKSDAVADAYAQARKKFLPNYDEDAKQPHLVYDARDMAGDDAWGQVSRVVDACLHQKEEEATSTNWIDAVTARGRWAESVLTVLRGIPPDSPHAKYQVKCAILLNHMIAFHHKTSHGKGFIRGAPESLTKLFHIPLEPTTRFLELFATSMTDDKFGNEGYACSKQDKDRCRVHLLLLYLMAHGPSMKVGNITPIVSDIKMEISQAAQLLREAGCTVSKRGKSNTWSAALKVPLQFPAPKRARGKS